MKRCDGLVKRLMMMQERPALFEPGDPHMWDDPYIAKQMLKAHLSHETDAASRRSIIIDQTIQFWLMSGLIRRGARILDLGCGPGLYAQRLARAGCQVVGVDLSDSSLDYARSQAESEHLDIDYRKMNFLDLEEEAQFDVVLQVYGELNTFSDGLRDQLLSRIHRSLKPGGLFIFDVSTRQLRQKSGLRRHWYVEDQGFWRPGPCLVLEDGFDYPDNQVWLDQYIVVDDQAICVYRNWYHDYSLESISDVLLAAGFSLSGVWNDLTGSIYTPDGDWIAIAAEKP